MQACRKPGNRPARPVCMERHQLKGEVTMNRQRFGVMTIALGVVLLLASNVQATPAGIGRPSAPGTILVTPEGAIPPSHGHSPPPGLHPPLPRSAPPSPAIGNRSSELSTSSHETARSFQDRKPAAAGSQEQGQQDKRQILRPDRQPGEQDIGLEVSSDARQARQLRPV